MAAGDRIPFVPKAGIQVTDRGNQPDPAEVDRRLRELSEEIGKPRVHEPSALERLVAAKQAEKKAQRKRDTGVLTALTAAFVLRAGGGVFTWLRVAPPSWLHLSAHTSPSARTAPSVKLTATPLSPVTANGPPADPFAGTPADGSAGGTAGIAIPAAKARGQFTAAQVRSAYETTRKLLVGGILDGLRTTALYKEGSSHGSGWEAAPRAGCVMRETGTSIPTSRKGCPTASRRRARRATRTPSPPRRGATATGAMR